MKSIIIGESFWKKENESDAKTVMEERPRRRKLQGLPPKVENLLLVFG